MKVKITDIGWDKDCGDETNLPQTVEVDVSEVYPNMADDISEWLSDRYGYCHEGFRYELEGDGKAITKDKIEAAKRVLVDNGIESDEADTVLQAIGYALLDKELFGE